MRTVYQNLVWLKQELQNAGLRLLDEASPEAVEEGHEEPWYHVEAYGDELVIQGNYKSLEVQVLDTDGAVLLRLPCGVNDGGMLDDIVSFIELRIGAPLKPGCPTETMRTIAAELSASTEASRVINELIGTR